MGNSAATAMGTSKAQQASQGGQGAFAAVFADAAEVEAAQAEAST